MTPLLELRDFGATRNGRPLASPLNLRLHGGTVLGVVGPNGVGKSSLLGALAHTGVSHFGEALLNGDNLLRQSATTRARHLSLLAQRLTAPHQLKVRELVEIGAHSSRRVDPPACAREAMESVGIEELAERQYGTLSGGQQQLAQIARVLAQDTPIVIFDEPTAALDLGHQRAVEQHLRRLGNDNKIVITALHDLSLALNVCTQLLLLDRNGGAIVGPPGEVLDAERVFAAYGVHTSIHTTPHGRHILTTDPIRKAPR